MKRLTFLSLCTCMSLFIFTLDAATEACLPTYYGEDCVQRCSTNCLDQLCHNVTGECHQCQPDKTGTFCDKSCPPRFHGQGCSRNCSGNCGGDGSCSSDGAGSVCSHGCQDGYTGRDCTTACEKGKYGKDCQYSCSEHCKTDTREPSVCYHVTGVCLMGCESGYEGNTCMKETDDGSDPGLAIGIGATLGLMTVIVVVVIFSVVCYNRRSRVRETGQPESSEGNDGVLFTRQEKPALKPAVSIKEALESVSPDIIRSTENNVVMENEIEDTRHSQNRTDEVMDKNQLSEGPVAEQQNESGVNSVDSNHQESREETSNKWTTEEEKPPDVDLCTRNSENHDTNLLESESGADNGGHIPGNYKLEDESVGNLSKDTETCFSEREREPTIGEQHCENQLSEQRDDTSANVERENTYL